MLRTVITYSQPNKINNEPWVSADGLWSGSTWQELSSKLHSTALESGASMSCIHDTPVYPWSRLFIAYTSTAMTNKKDQVKPKPVESKPKQTPAVVKPTKPEKPEKPESAEDMGFSMFD